MTSLRLYSGTAVVLSLIGCSLADAAAGQNLERRISGAGNGLLQFNYPAREGVCGNGKTFVNIGGNSWYGTINDATRREVCETGPVRVVMNQAGGQIVSIETFVGPVQTESGVNVKRTPDSVLQSQLDAWDKILPPLMEDAFFAKVVDSQKAWCERVV